MEIIDPQATKTGNEEISIFDNTDPLPEYYSKRAINAFAILFSAVFGAVMMAVNLSKTRDKKGIWQVLVFGVVYVVVQVFVADHLHLRGLSTSLLLNLPGSYIMTKLFWDKYIGANAPYKPKSVLVPVIIAAVIFGGIIALAFFMPAALE